MSSGNVLGRLWQRAQGVPEPYIWKRLWNDPTLFRACPEECVVCGRAWRPDDAPYIAVWGVVAPGAEHWLEWNVPSLGLYGLPTGNAQDHIRKMCHYHRDRWETVVDVQTGQPVELLDPLSRWDRMWRDVLYWSGTAMRFVYLVVQWGWLWAEHKVTGRGRVYIRGPWPPLRVQKG